MAIPSAEVKLPSDPPPTTAPSRLKPSFVMHALASSKSVLFAGVGSSGGRLRSPVSVTLTLESLGE